MKPYFLVALICVTLALMWVALAVCFSISRATTTVAPAAPQLSAPKPQPGWSVWTITWPTVPGAAVYQIFLEGRAAGIQIPSSPITAPRQGYSLPVTCGMTHKINVRAGDTTAKNGAPGGWGPFATPQYWTPPPC